MNQSIDENDIQNVRHGLMEFLCENTRHNTRHKTSIDFEIEQIRVERFPTISNQDYFIRIVTIIAERYIEIEVRGPMVKLTHAGLDVCGRFVANFQHDF